MFHKHFPENTFFISDIHAFHKNICGPISSWSNKDNCRNFETIERMNNAIINGINDYIGQDDHLFTLGDILFGDRNKLYSFVKRINCKNIYHIFGNHDDKIRNSPDIDKCFSWYGDYLEIFIDKTLICLSHYPFSVWRDCHKGSYMLCGHSHGTFFPSTKDCKDQGKILDVGWDCFQKPLDYKTIKSIMDTKSVAQKDHHNGRTT